MRRYSCMTLMAVFGGALAGCGGNGGSAATAPGPAPVPMTQMVDTVAVLAQARVASETAQPYTVDDGALEFTDTSDTTQPIGIDGN